MTSNSIASKALKVQASLLTLEFQDMYRKWGANKPPRTGLHASSLLVAESEWCPRRHVLSALYPDQAESPELANWQWKQQAVFENGWRLHERWQDVLLKSGLVAMGTGSQAHLPELDLTHYDEDCQLYFSPDAIIDYGGERFIVEIKGINDKAFASLTDDLEQARKACETVNKAVVQANLYLHLLDLTKAIILVENKNTQEFKVWVIEYDKQMAMEYMHRVYEVKGALILARRNGPDKLPMRVCASRYDPLAKKCPLQGMCFKGEQ
jgi:hypothetical protein